MTVTTDSAMRQEHGIPNSQTGENVIKRDYFQSPCASEATTGTTPINKNAGRKQATSGRTARTPAERAAASALNRASRRSSSAINGSTSVNGAPERVDRRIARASGEGSNSLHGFGAPTASDRSTVAITSDIGDS